MIFFYENQLNHFREIAKIQPGELGFPGININHLFIFNNILRNKKAKDISFS